MRNAPVLAECGLAPGDGYRHPRVMRVIGGLCSLRGNRTPYFSLTHEAHRVNFPRKDKSGGAAHELILEHFPQFVDLAALHLSGVDGVPVHAEANGWYWLAGALGGMQQQYHGGNSTPARTADECLAIFARLCRISVDDARELAQRCADADGAAAARAEWRSALEAMRQRWKAEADACIAKHGLVVYGQGAAQVGA